ncbi:VOC family protein [bacterium]|nr:MAG: VOC family protein [bacterium]
MTAVHRVVHFELPADDPERAAAFYRAVFGWDIHKWDGPQDYWLVQTGEEQPGIDGGILRRMDPRQGTVNTVSVDDLDAMVTTATKAGAKVVMPRMAIPGIGYLSYLSDTEGNTFGMLEPDEGAH